MPLWRLPDGTESTVCPAKLVREKDRQLLRFYAAFRHGVLPVPGGLLDQTAYFYDAMIEIERWVGRARSS